MDDMLVIARYILTLYVSRHPAILFPSMSRFLKLALPALILLSLLTLPYLQRAAKSAKRMSREKQPARQVSVLGKMPDWKSLERYQKTITREDFEHLLTQVFTTSEVWKNFIQIDDEMARIKTRSADSDEMFELRFAKPGMASAVPREWRTTAELPPSPAGKPLDGLKIAIDPGHIGGEWAKIEERWFVVGDGKPVAEGEMTLQVAKLLKPQLEALGANVSMVRELLEPVTSQRPENLQAIAKDSGDASSSPFALQKLAERLFYRTAEIHARADLVNEQLKPDLVLCLHFNAEGWGNPLQPAMIDRTHFHLILNGGYTDDEVMLTDQRFEMLRKLLQRTHEEEVAVGSNVARVFAQISGLPAYTYNLERKNVREIPGQPYLWARNLLANRLYNCPVIFMEPYVMNSSIDYARIQAGDYEGLREIDGKMQPSIFREYANALAESLAVHYAAERQGEK